jgi:multidrug resistance efflux pump
MKTQADLAATTYKRGENLYQQGVISRQRRDEMLQLKPLQKKPLKQLTNNMHAPNAAVQNNKNQPLMLKLLLLKPR